MRARFRRWLTGPSFPIAPHDVSGAIRRLDRRTAVNTNRAAETGHAKARELRRLIRKAAWLRQDPPTVRARQDGLREFQSLFVNRHALRPVFEKTAATRVLFVGQCYYYSWYLSRALRRLGWSADLLNWDTNPKTQIYYHGEDFRFSDGDRAHQITDGLAFYLDAIYNYDIFHFSNAHGISFGSQLQEEISDRFGRNQEIHLLKDLGKKIVYTNNGCLDGVSQTSFASWGETPVCAICRWRNQPIVCSDERNLQWGSFRNSVADFQCLLGGNRIDFNDAPTVHEVPEAYCIPPDLWRPDLEVPDHMRCAALPAGGVRLYHGIGERSERTDEEGVNIKCSHIYRPLLDRLRRAGYLLDILEPTAVPNVDVRFLQVQADIFLDMLTYGWFGATAKEGMMLGKPVIAYIRPEWLESLRQELPDYAAELPVVNATPDTIELVLRDLIDHPEKRNAIGQRSRAFALKWHSDDAAGRRFDQIYRRLLEGDRQLRDTAA